MGKRYDCKCAVCLEMLKYYKTIITEKMDLELIDFYIQNLANPTKEIVDKAVLYVKLLSRREQINCV